MLTLTDSASSVVKTITARTPDSTDAGLRISADRPGAADFAVVVAPAPEPNDTVVESSGAKVYLEENAAVALDDKVLDAQISEDGSVQFAIGSRD
jgi:iron-sulfur cluster assembly protein